jgi:hypothetical protein
MLLKKRFRPLLESLESRLTPSVTTRFSSGILSITGDNTPGIAVSLTAAGAAATTSTILVKVNGNTINTFANVSQVTVSLGNGPGDSVNVALAGKTLTSNLQFTLGNGTSDNVTINDGTTTGRIGVNFGSGGPTPATSDVLGVGTGTVATALNGILTVLGSSQNGVQVNIGGKTATADLVGGGVFTNVNAFTQDAASTEHGSITINNGNFLSSSNVTLPGTVGGNFAMTTGPGASTVTLGGTIGGFAQVTGYNGSDSVSVSGTVGKNFTFSNQGADTITMTKTTSIGGNVTLNLGSANTYHLADEEVIGGNFYLTSGSGGDNIVLGDGTAGMILGYVSMNLGNASNSLTIANAFYIGGSLTYTGGNGGNALTFGGGTSGMIGGNVTVTVGNGTNSFTQNSGFLILGSLLNYTGGTGNDTFVVNNASNGYRLNVNTGGTAINGAGGNVDTVNLNGNSFAYATVTFGVLGTAGTNKIWGPPSGTTPLTLINFP